MADLVDGRYPQTNPLWSALGQLTNITQSDIPARSNAEYFGIDTADNAIGATGVGIFVPVPVDVGTIVSKVTILVGATAGATMTHQFAAIYSGIATPALIAQSTDTTSAAIPASAAASWTLSSPQLITSALAPNGFIYAGVAITAATVPTAASQATPTATSYQWFSNSPLFFSATAGSALGGTAASTIASPTKAATAPLVFLT